MSWVVPNEYAPDFVSPPGDTLEETLEAKGMSQRELAQRMGRPVKTINEIIQGKAAITPETALQLERVLGVPASFWSNLEQQYREFMARRMEWQQLEQQVAWLHEVPWQEMVKRGWVARAADRVEQVRGLLQFFGVASTEQWHAFYDQPTAAFRMTPAYQADSGSIAAWLRRGELLAQEIACRPFETGPFREALAGLRALTTSPFAEARQAAVERCAALGVAVVFVEGLPRTRACGATRWLSPQKALIQLSFRYKSEDHLWFTFFHEAGHIVLHGKRDVFVEGLSQHTDKEAEADQFAADVLISRAAWSAFLRRGSYRSTAGIAAFAREVGIAAGIVVGRLQHEGVLPHSHANDLRRPISRQEWADVATEQAGPPR